VDLDLEGRILYSSLFGEGLGFDENGELFFLEQDEEDMPDVPTENDKVEIENGAVADTEKNEYEDSTATENESVKIENGTATESGSVKIETATDAESAWGDITPVYSYVA